MKKILIPTMVLIFTLAITAQAMIPPPPKPPESTVKKTSVEKLNKEELKKADPVCAQAALEEKEGVVINAYKKYTEDWIASIRARTDARKAAFNKTGTERVKANRLALKTAETTQKRIQKELNQTRSAAVDAMRLKLRLCGFDASTED